jgi:hypothetical protein
MRVSERPPGGAVVLGVVVIAPQLSGIVAGGPAVLPRRTHVFELSRLSKSDECSRTNRAVREVKRRESPLARLGCRKPSYQPGENWPFLAPGWPLVASESPRRKNGGAGCPASGALRGYGTKSTKRGLGGRPAVHPQVTASSRASVNLLPQAPASCFAAQPVVVSVLGVVGNCRRRAALAAGCVHVFASL